MNQGGSFIPRQTPGSAVRKKVRKRIYVLAYVTYVIFFGILIIAAGLFVWDMRLSGALTDTREKLNQERNAFSQSDMERIRELDQQLQLVNELVDSHPAPSLVLAALSESILASVQLDAFTIEPSESAPNAYTISLSGVAPNFSALLFQREVFSANPILASAEIAELTYPAQESSGTALQQQVTFGFEAEVPVDRFVFTGVTTPAPALEESTESALDDLPAEASIESDGAEVDPASQETEI
jgi:hypothetical protein